MRWETVPLGEVARYVRGVTYKPADVVLDEGIACLRTKNIQSVLDLRDLVYVDEHVTHRLEQRVQPDDVLVSSANSWHLVGRAVRATQAAAGMLIGGFIGALRFNTARIDPAFGYRWFSSPEVQARVRSFGQQTTNIANLNVDRTLRLDIPLPPLAEQRRIAAILDAADAMRERSAYALDQTVGLRAVTFRQASAHVSRRATLGEVTQMYGGSSLPQGDTFAGQTDGYLLLKVSDLNLPGNEFSIVRAREWSREAGSRASTAPSGSVVLPKRGASISTNKKRLLKRSGILDPNLMAVHGASGTLHSDWLLAWFESFDLRTIQSGSSVPQLNKQDLAPLEIPLPAWGHQLLFSETVAAISDEVSRQRRRLRKLDELFASLQHRAFRGEL